MYRPRPLFRLLPSLLVAGLLLGFAPAGAMAQNEGQEDLDRATELQLEAGNDGRKIAEVIQLLNSAIEKGLDDESREFAEEMLVGALLQRGSALATALLNTQLPSPQVDPRWTQVRNIALADLNRVLEIDSEQHAARILVARLLLLPQGDSDAATKLLEQVIEAEEVESEVRAEAYARRAATQTEAEEQQADLDQAIELEPDQAEYRLMRARHHFGQKAFDKALEDVDRVLGDHEESAAAHELRGTILAAQEKPEEALEALNRATELAPNALSPYLHRSQIYANLGNLDQAVAEATKIVDMQPNLTIGLLLRSNYYLQDSRPEEALADIDRALEITPSDPTALLTKARILASMGREREALEQLEETAEAAPQVALHLQVGQFALQLEMPRRAIAAFDKAIKLDPDNALLLRFRGDAKLNISDHEGAVADFEAAMKIDADDEGLLNNLAWVLATSPNDKVRDGQRAIELATKACELSEFKKPHILSTLAAAYAESGDFETAKKWAEKAVELEEDGEDAEQLAQELENYRQGKPVREAQMRDSGEKEGTAEQPAPKREDKPAESKPAPGRTIDF